MERKEQPDSELPEGSQEHTFFVYDEESGEVVHAHKAIVLPYGDTLSSEDLERQALGMAEQFTKRKRSTLKALRVREGEIEPGSAYRVDKRSGKLERIQPGRSA